MRRLRYSNDGVDHLLEGGDGGILKRGSFRRRDDVFEGVAETVGAMSDPGFDGLMGGKWVA